MTKLTLLFLSFLMPFSICLGQIQLKDVKIDLKLTGFKYATTLGDMMVYLPNGKQDLASKKDPSSFSIHTEPDMNYERSVGYIDYQIEYSRKNGISVSNISRNDTMINGNRFIEVTFVETIKEINSVRQNYYAILLKGTTALIFLSGDVDDGKYIEKLKRTFRSVTI